ncbi:neuroglobin-like [Ruditapes philippinarum]|uniref:neuroglobin-like n=1 Tax=Ruditapes philippinarum TaxID=129788 RepID=UPI00295B90C2|nr:neuroglobin-like [Ruditapes philippinarum]
MGCTNSISYNKHSIKTFTQINDPIKSRIVFTLKCQIELTGPEIKTVQQTWPSLAKDLQGNGLQLFLRIFEICPEVKLLFKVENVRHSQLARNATIQAHGKRFISAIGSAVDCLENFDREGNTLCKFLFDLGQQHQNFKGFKPEYFEIFYEALMCQWAICMRDRFTPDVANAWSHLFVFLMEKLKEGYYSHEVSYEAHLKNNQQYH